MRVLLVVVVAVLLLLLLRPPLCREGKSTGEGKNMFSERVRV